VAEGMAQERDLAVVEVGLAELPLRLADLASLSSKVGVQLVDGPADDLQLVKDEVGRVEAVGLRVEEGTAVLTGSAVEDRRDRQERTAEPR